MDIEHFKSKIPSLIQWIDDYVENHQTTRKKVADTNFDRFDHYLPSKLLENTYCVYVEKVKTPPFKELGLEYLSGLDAKGLHGITYNNTFFINKKYRKNANALHFHEMIHIIQYSELGPKQFLLLYGCLFYEFGYENSPLELIAKDYEKKYSHTVQIPFLDQKVRSHCRNFLKESGL